MKKCPYCKRGYLTPAQMDILSRIKREVTSREMALTDRISVGNASNQLRSLFRAGFLKRESLPDDTGGYFFVYSRV